MSQVKGDKADSETSEVVVLQEGCPGSFHGHLWNSSIPEVWRLQACGIAPTSCVSLQFSKHHGGGQRLNLEGEAGAQGQGWSEWLRQGQGADVSPEGWMGTKGGRNDRRTFHLTSVSLNSSLASCPTSSSGFKQCPV